MTLLTRKQYHRDWKRRKHGYNPRKEIPTSDIQGIKALLSLGMKQITIARAYGISQSLVSIIKRRNENEI